MAEQNHNQEPDSFQSFADEIKALLGETVEEPEVTDPVEETPVIEVGSSQLTEAELTDMVKTLEKEFGKEKVTKLLAMDDSIVEPLFQKMANLNAGSVSLNQRNQNLAEEKRRFDAEKAQFERDIQATATTKADYEQKIIDAQNKLKEIEDAIAEKNALLEKKPDAEGDILGAQRLITNQTLATEDIKRYQEQKAAIEKNVEDLKNATLVQADVLERLNLAKELQGQYPELQTKRPVAYILNDYHNGKEVDDEDLIKTFRINKIIEDYLSIDSKKGISDFYKIEKHNLPPLPDQKSKVKKVPLREALKSVLKDAPVGTPPPASPKDTKVGDGSFRKKTGWNY